jgi:hypothetical protein
MMLVEACGFATPFLQSLPNIPHSRLSHTITIPSSADGAFFIVSIVFIHHFTCQLPNGHGQ